ncbi:putative ATPase [Ilumatobacter fluminis]|uniref:Putative ATPase n=1 Tax=Ilumatobacter fluminis TaxID=467091 RepID=A0A4V3EII2_9ACTN|nr:BTAD domain-containing putative transcriptional regulator [Ilumatobacter fluminis]TDT14618.1 putative ATPase [Ilumatobacter fluminis]
MADIGRGALVEVLGPLRVVADGVDVGVTRAAQRRVLAILALAGGRPVDAEVLIDRMWSGEPPATAKTALQTHISALRRLLPEGAIRTEHGGYVIDTAVLTLDTTLLDTELTETTDLADAGDWHTAGTTAAEALARVRGEPFHDLVDDDFAIGERTRLTEVVATLTEFRLEAQLEIGQAGAALAGLERLTAEYPLRERGWRLLVRARSASGRTAEALRAVQDARAAMAEAGLTIGTELVRLEADLFLDEDQPAVERPRTNLVDPLTTFIGRDELVDDVATDVAEHRLVTLHGVGGVGKTRVAREVARRHVDAGGAAWFVDLSVLDEASDVASAVVAAIGILSEAPTVDAALQAWAPNTKALVVLDNCEHVASDAGRVTRFLLDHGARITVLATSRRLLGVPGERVVALPPIPVVDPGGPVGELTGNDAVRLFVDRARLVGGLDGMTPDVARSIAAICRRLDGLPLAIELAAARTRHMTLDTIDRRLDERFTLLTTSDGDDDRHGALASVVGWSYDLLSPAQATVLRAISVFRGTFDLPSAATVVELDEAATADALGALVDDSLVVFERPTGSYRLLETVRAFAAIELDRAGAHDLIEARHLALRVGTCVALEPAWLSTGMHEAIESSRGMIDDLVALVDDTSARQRPDTARIALHLGRWFRRDFKHPQAAHYLTAAEGGLDDALENERLSLLSRELWAVGRSEEAWVVAQASRDAADRLPDSTASAAALCRYANIRLNRLAIDAGDAVEVNRAGVEMARRLGDPAFLLRTEIYLAASLAFVGESAEALPLIDDIRRRAIDLGDHTTVLESLTIAGHVCRLCAPTDRDLRRALLDDLFSRFDFAEALVDEDASLLIMMALELGETALARRMVAQVERQQRSPTQATGLFTVTGLLLRRFDGDADGVWADVEPLLTGCHERMASTLHTIAADVAADRGDLAGAYDVLRRFESYEISPTQRSELVGVLAAVVRAEVDAGHRDAAVETLDRIRSIMRDHPPRAEGTRAIERPAVYALMAEAEVASMIGGADLAWQAVAREAAFEFDRQLAVERHRRSA